MNQKLFEFLSSKGFTPMMSDYEEIRHLMSLEHCTPTERAFLDEIREKGKWVANCQINIESDKEPKMLAILNQKIFSTPLEGLVNGK